MSAWLGLNQIDHESLQQSTLTLHHAAQLLASTAESLLPSKADDSHTNLGWNKNLQALVTHPIEDRYQLALAYASFSLSILDKGVIKTRFSLSGETREGVYHWLQGTFNKLGIKGGHIKALSRYDIPKHPVQEGRPFSKPIQEILTELAQRRNNAQEIFVSIAPEYPYASSIRTWPHHFDMGVYIPIRRDESHQDLNSIGLGMAVPDGSVNDMYYYVNHWSKQTLTYPNSLPELAGGGHWYQGSWTGAVLPLTVVTAAAQSHDQQEIVQTFFDSAITASLQLIGEV
ncbi:MAG: hypothetical protein KTR30_15090 [Saprospiraceae bacterium]|nr:hypothetical protein [Saprospiraceae bacterium]